MFKIVQFILYWSFISAVLLVLSPILIPAMIFQIFFIDIKFWDIFRGAKKGWDDLASGRAQKLADARFFREERARRLKKKQEVENTYRTSLNYAQKMEYDETVKNLGYDPDTDPDASHKKHPYKPTFAVPVDTELYKQYRRKWFKIAQQSAHVPLVTKSHWDLIGSNRLHTIFLEAYRTTFFEPMDIMNENEHLWVVETCSLPYYEVEYQLEMLNKLYAMDPTVARGREFRIRYKLLEGSIRRLRDRGQDAPKMIDKIMTAKAEESARGLENAVDAFFNFTKSWKENKLFFDQCDYFDREAKKARKNG